MSVAEAVMEKLSALPPQKQEQVLHYVETLQRRASETARLVAGHAPITLEVTKEAIRRIQAARALPDGDDLIAKTYGSTDFKEGVRAFVEKRPPRWTGK